MNSKTTIPATEARAKFFKIIEEVSESKTVYTITKNGRAKVVILGTEEFDKMAKILKPELVGFYVKERAPKYKTAKITRIYLDTSVPNYLFADDRPDRQEITKKFFDDVKSKNIKTLTSSVTEREIYKTKDLQKKNQLSKAIQQFQVKTIITEEEKRLAQLYLKNKIVPEEYLDDALHLAIATVERVDALISWNFKHMVNLKVKKGINKINIENGYQALEIITPEEFMGGENENIA